MDKKTAYLQYRSNENETVFT